MAEHSVLERLALLAPVDLDRVIGDVPSDLLLDMAQCWRWTARPSQLAPAGAWSQWLILACRGFGKTRAGAEWVTEQARRVPDARFALVGVSAHDVTSVMVEGESGLLAVSGADFEPEWLPSRRLLAWPNGAQAFVLSAAEPNQLRGPQFHFAWCDELAAWPKPREAWDNLRMGLRLGHHPQVVVTTTPRALPLLRALLEMPGTVVTRGTTFDNRTNLPREYLADLDSSYSGTSLGRQELLGEMLEAQEGALWSLDGLATCRAEAAPELVRVVVGVDPPAGPGGCGVVVAGVDAGGVGYVLADASVQGTTPEAWAAAVAAAFERHQADRVVVETNNGGDMVESILRAASINLPVKQVRASRGKAARAEPVSALYSAGRVRHLGHFPDLEDELCGLVLGGGYVGPGTSPDRADALVWALTELMLGGRGPGPQVRLLGG
jgi:phage terminase large subunit-like protein